LSGGSQALVSGGGWDAGILDDSWLLTSIAQSVLDRAGATGWSLKMRGIWCGLEPPEMQKRAQGWKLHLSATQLSAPVVLARAAEVLVREKCAFKFAPDFGKLQLLLSNLSERGSGGKFITAYPAEVEQFRRLAARLDAATDGLPGPVILSDRRLRPGSLVHYRYGAFHAEKVLTDAGSFASTLTAPDGSRVKDERLAWFSPPSWAELPFPDPEAPTGGSAGGATSVLIAGRFAVSRAIRHSYRGGVFYALDQETGAEVVLKQARPHVMASLEGTDARDFLRHEAQVLELLGPLELAPRMVALVTHQEDLFLAEELVPGVTLRRWADERVVGAWHGRGAPPGEAAAMAGELVEIVAGVHEQGLVLRDLSPNNVMVTPEGRLRLIDLEHVVPVGSRRAGVQTKGYVAPEVIVGRFGPVPSQPADLFSLGASILFLATGIDPLFGPDAPADRSVSDRLGTLLGRLGDHMPVVRPLAELVLGFMDHDPERRWSLARARGFLKSPDVTLSPTRSDLPVSDSVIDRLLADGLSYVVGKMTPLGPRLWPTVEGDQTDSCNVQFGAAGVLGVLTRAAEILGDQRLSDGVEAAAGWIDRRLFAVPRLLPGLYFGRSGTAWSLYDAARLLGDDELASRALELARQMPAAWHCPDISHGIAGAGLAYLHLSLATGDPEFERRVVVAADAVLAAARERDGQLFWPIPDTFDSLLAGRAHYGFGHGVAGAGAFLLYAGQATGREDCLDAARRAGCTLEAGADIEDGAAWWPVVPKGDDRNIERVRHWCSGSAGVGTFLIRLWSVTGEERWRALAEAAAAAVYRERWYSNATACHGLSGHGDFLLDIAEFTGEQRYRDWARELVAVMHTRHLIHDGLMLIPDESAVDVTAGYNTGLSGFLGFLLRLRHGGRRLWLPDELLEIRSA